MNQNRLLYHGGLFDASLLLSIMFYPIGLKLSGREDSGMFIGLYAGFIVSQIFYGTVLLKRKMFLSIVIGLGVATLSFGITIGFIIGFLKNGIERNYFYIPLLFYFVIGVLLWEVIHHQLMETKSSETAA